MEHEPLIAEQGCPFDLCFGTQIVTNACMDEQHAQCIGRGHDMSHPYRWAPCECECHAAPS